MGFANFKNIIEVVIGAGWINNKVHFAEDELVILQLQDTTAEELIYTEDGTNTPGPNNRLKVFFLNQQNTGTTSLWTNIAYLYPQQYVATASWAGAPAIVFGASNTVVNYTNKDLWTQTSLAYGFLATGAAQYIATASSFYNPHIFKAMSSYDGYAESLSESLDLDDSSYDIQRVLYPEVAEGLTISEAAAYSPQIVVLTDGLTISSAQTISWVLENADGLTISEAGTNIVANYYKAIAEGLTLSDTNSLYLALNFLNEDTLNIINVLKWSWGQNLTDSLTESDTITADVGLTLKEHISLIETIASQWKGTEALADKLSLVDTASLAKFFWETIADGMTITDAITLGINFLLAEVVALSCAISSIGKFQHSLAESASVSDLTKISWEKSLADGLTISESLLKVYVTLVAITESLTMDEALTPETQLNNLLTDSLDISNAITVKMIMQEILSDGLDINVELVIDDEVWECWVVNTNDFNVSVYSGFNFNSYCEYAGNAYGANATGIYGLEGTTDDGTAFKSGIVLPATRFGIANNKKFRRAHFGISGTTPSLRVETDNGSATYTVASAKANIARSLKGKTWTLKVQDFDSLDFIELIPIILTR